MGTRIIWITIAAAVVVLAAIGAAIYLLIGEPADGPAPPVEESISQEAALRLLELRNVGLGHLENQQVDESLPLLEQLHSERPDDPFGPQNLTVAQLLRIETLDPVRQAEPRRQALQQARASLEELKRMEGDTAITHILAGLLALREENEKSAIQEFTAAARLEPDDPAIWYEVYQAGQYSREDALQTEAFAALQRAYELAPTNIFILTEWLMHQADTRDPGIVQTLQQARTTLQPFAESIQAHTRLDLLQMLDQAIEAAQQQMWPVVLRNVRAMSPVLRHEPVAQSDLRRVKRHPLEYVRLDFNAAFYEQADLPPPAAPPAIAVSLSAEEKQLPGLSGVRAVTVADFDLDQQPDVAVLRTGRLEIYRRPSMDAEWQPQMAADVADGLQQILAADLDDDADQAPPPPADAEHPERCHDADPDVILFGQAGVSVLRNQLSKETGERTFETVEQNSGLQNIKQVRTGSLIDLDHDGDLDLALATAAGVSLWLHRGDLTFEEISDRSELPPAELAVTAFVPVDWDRDTDLDLVVAGDSPTGGYLENLRHGRFRWREFPAEAGGLNGAVDLAVVEINGNAAWDILAVGPAGLAVTRTVLPVPGTVQILDSRVIDPTTGQNLWTWDYDNDAYLDVLLRTDDGLNVLRGLGGGRFENQPNLTQELPQDVSSVAFADLDHDGDTDLVLATDEGVRLLSNDGGNANHWLDLSLRAQQVKGSDPSASGRVNHYAIGSLIELKAGPQYQAQTVTGPTTHFGLGPQPRADVARVLWTNGVPRNIVQPQPDERICELQTLLGSCPYLYTWTGSRYEFLTDLLWAAPIGLLFGEGEVAPWREWEYLKIPGERLVEQDGEYRIQITEELWEAGYFDQVELIAIDHPAEVEIFTNEKVGPPALAEHKIHTVRQRRLPVAARDRLGRDVLPIVSKEDGQYFKGFERKFKQGLTEEHFLELDLGDLSGAKQITLFLTGWVYPTDTSINVALSQNPKLESSRPPALWVPDADGNWQEVRPFMGFPGGKTKTIAVDLSDAFLTQDYRLRIVTNMEFYWDAAFFTVDEEPAEWRATVLPLVSADLHWRGFSRRVVDPGNGPETYDYQQVIEEPHWPPMEGYFTRYGDVRELLTAWDDRMVVFGAGDEITLAFRVPDEPLPDGWKRDFVLHNVGWDKDANMNTVYGPTVEPLPFRAMTVYGQSRELDPPYAEYLRTYQTREQSLGRFWFFIRDYQGQP